MIDHFIFPWKTCVPPGPTLLECKTVLQSYSSRGVSMYVVVHLHRISQMCC